ncbi:MAG: flagellar basal body P-ring formation protein FlgA [Alphaproteobacteria bacterium]|nr:flagellar basal body P-ring formation protein FlgA [Alphaproteobacteria bacterium]
MTNKLFFILLLAAASPVLAQSAPAGAATVPVTVLARPLDAGTLIGAGDLTVAQLPAPQARGGLDATALIGREAARRLNAGQPLRAYDVAAPQLVRRGQPVSIVVRRDNLVITAAGRALAGGAKGEAVRVQNSLSSAVIDAEVESAGVVRIVDAPAS